MLKCPICHAELEDNSQFCDSCGARIEPQPSKETVPSQASEPLEPAQSSEPTTPQSEVSETIQNIYCPLCGSPSGPEATFCTNCGASLSEDPLPPVISADVESRDEGTDKKTKKPLLITLLCILSILLAGLFAVGCYDFVKTKAFKEEISSFEEIETKYAGLGKCKSEYTELLANANDTASHFLFWKYEDLIESMDRLEKEIRDMNEAVAEYREQYDAIVAEIETDTHFVMDNYEEKYQSIKADLETALFDFDEKTAKKRAGDFSDIRDQIIAENEEMASACVEDARSIRDSFDGYGAHPFELYMIEDFVGRIESANDAQDYISLHDDYNQLKEWSDKFSVASLTNEQIAGFVQADVSLSDTVKLYLNSYYYDTYDFKLEDFIIYEENGGVWNECDAVSISQIKGSLTLDLVVDVSSSMSDDFYTMQQAVEGFVSSTYSDTVLGLSTIGSIYERHQDFTSDKNSIIDSAWNLDCYGLTSLYQSLYSSVVYTASAEGARCVVAFTDGHNEPYGSGYDYDAQDVIDVSNYYQVPVYIIGIGSGVYSSELKNIAEATGGSYYDRVSIYDLQSIYSSIYEAQGKLYELSYKTTVPNNKNRDIYVLYTDDSESLSVRLESQLNAEALQEAYETSKFRSDDPAAFYTDGKYLSSDDLSNLGSDLEAVQTVINIYYAKNGFKFGDSENGQKQLEKMLSLGVISENGTLDGDTVSALIMSNAVIYQNFSALYNYRYELIYSAAYDIYWNNPGISYEELRSQVHKHFGEENEYRFSSSTQAAWNAIIAG